MRRRDGHARSAVGFVLGAIAIGVAAAIVYWPGLRSFPEGDDFVLLAYARILRHPLALFVHEHFPLGPYFRPLSLTLWWASAQLFGTAIAPQYAINLLLHCAVCVVLWRVLCGIGGSARVAWVATLAFALHPIAIGTALWLANRFDLLATLFALLALQAAWRARQTRSAPQLALALGFVVCAALAKETGILAGLLVALLLLWPAPQSAAPRNRVAGLLALLIGLGWLAWRVHAVAIAPDAVGLAQRPLDRLLAGGAVAWLRDFVGYFTAAERMSTAAASAALAGVVLLAAAGAALARAGNVRVRAPVPDLRVALSCAALIVLAAGALSAPYACIWSVPFAHSAAPTSIAGYARLFYFPLCGIAIAAATLAGALRRAALPLARVLALAGAATLILAWAATAHDLANAYRRQSNLKRPLMQAAVDAVALAPLPAARCRIFLLGDAQAPPDYVLTTSADAVIKALARDETRVENCLIQSEQASWLNLLGGAPLNFAAALPLQPMQGAHGPAPWLAVGGVQIAYLNLDRRIEPRSLTDAVFLQRRGVGFDDVSARVLDGSLTVRFVCARSDRQCGGGP